MPARLTLLLAAALLALPVAAAGGTLSVPGATATLEDSRGGECDEVLLGFCLFAIHPADSPGDASVDVYQEVRALTVTVAPAPDAPDATLALSAEEVYLRHPVLRTAREAWDAHEPPYPAREQYGFRMDDRGARAYYHGPVAHDLGGPWRRGSVGGEYANGFTEDQVGPHNAPQGGETDGNWRGLHKAACNWGVAEDECRPVAFAASDALVASTPNVRAGVQVYDVAVTTDEDGLPRAGRANGTLPLALDKRAPVLDAPAPQPRAPSLSSPAPAAPAPRADPAGPTAPRPEPVTVAGARPAPAAPQGDARALALAASAGVALALLLALLYTRLARARIFDQATRSRVYERVLQAPGASVSGLARDLTLGRTTVRHHVKVLAGHGLVRAQRVGRETLVFPVAAPHDRTLAALLGSGEARRKVAAALVAGAATQRALQDATGLSQRLVSYHLERLRKGGLVTEGGGWPRAYAPTPALLALGAPQGRVQGATS